MKALILAAGYGTRLVNSAKEMEDCELKSQIINNPKPLVPLAGKPIIEYLIRDLEKIDEIDKILIVTNGNYYEAYSNWKQGFNSTKEIKIINDNTMTNETRLGAIRDMKFVLEQENIDEDTIVMGGDNVMTWDINHFLAYFKEKNCTVMAGRDLKDKNLVRNKFGVLEIDENNKMIGFEEKPDNPKTSIAATSIYSFKKEDLALIDEYLESGSNPDAPGFFMEWLHKKTDVHTYIFDPEKFKWFDIGDLDTYKQACEAYKPQ